MERNRISTGSVGEDTVSHKGSQDNRQSQGPASHRPLSRSLTGLAIKKDKRIWYSLVVVVYKKI